MIGSLALLIVSFVKLDSKWCSALVQRVSSFILMIRLFARWILIVAFYQAPYLNPNFVCLFNYSFRRCH